MSQRHAFMFLCESLNPLFIRDIENRLRRTLSAPEFSWEELVMTASEHKVSAMMSSTLEKHHLTSFLPTDLVAYFEGVAELNGQRNAQIGSQSLEIAAILNKIDVEPVFLKGAGNLLAGLYESPEHRVMVDIDILVPPELLLKCVATLKKSNYATGDADIVDDPHSHHYAPLSCPGRATSAELHSEIIAFPDGNLLTASEVLSNVHAIQLDGVRFGVPSVQNRMIHTIAHNQVTDRQYLHGFIHIRQFIECLLLQNISGPEINWHQIERRFASNGLHLPYACQIIAMKQLFNANIPTPQKSNWAGNLYLKRAILQLGHPRTTTTVSRILKSFSLLKRSLFDAKLARRLLRNVTRPDWFRRHWRSVFRK